MQRSIILWYTIKFLNLNQYFRRHVHELKFCGKFYLKHKDHFGDHEGYREPVKFIDYDEKKKEYTVKRISHKDGQKAIVIGVKKSQLYLNAN